MRTRENQEIVFQAKIVASSFIAFAFVIMLGCSSPAPEPLADFITGQDAGGRGAELVRGLAACGFCHGEQARPDALLLGGRAAFDRYGEVLAANLTSSASGLAGWTSNDILRALRESVDKNANDISHEIHNGYEWMSDSDTLAIIGYIQSLPAVENSVSRRSLGFITRNTKGLTDVRKSVRGYVPDIAVQHQREYGQYLADHVARCNSCHAGAESLFGDAPYLGGGQPVRTDAGEKIAPNISGDSDEGIGNWSEAQLLSFFKNATTPDHRRVDSQFCPVEFYARARDTDLAALILYLKSVPAAH